MTSAIAKAKLKFFEQVSVIYDCHSKVFSQCGIILKLPCKVYEEFDEESGAPNDNFRKISVRKTI